MPLATIGRVYAALITLSLVATVAGLNVWGSEKSPWEAEEPPAESVIPLQHLRQEYAAETGEVAAEIVEEVEAAEAAVAQLTPVPTEVPATPPPPVETPSPAPVEAPPVEPPAPAPEPEPEPVFAPLSIPVPVAPAPPPPPPPPPGFMNYALADELLVMINGARQAEGLPLLSRHGSLMAAAEEYARFHFLNHDPFQLNHYLDGSPGDRAARHGFGGLTAEVLVVGPVNGRQLFESWMGSPAHHDILLAGAYLNIGIACYQGPVQGNGGTFEAALCVGDLGS